MAKLSISKRLCRLLSYITTGVFFLTGFIFFCIGAAFAAQYSGSLPSFTGASSQTTITINGDSTQPAASPPAASSTPAPIADVLGATPTYIWFPILWGIFIMAISSVGYCGIRWYSRLMLAIYIILVLLVFIIQLILALVFITENQEDIIGMKSDDNARIRDVMSKSADAVVNSFFAFLAIEIFVMATSACFRMQLTGDERNDETLSRYADIESEMAGIERDKRRKNFEMQSQKVADTLKKGPGGFFK